MTSHPSRPVPSALELAQGLIRCPSVTPEEGGALAYLAGVLEGAGFRVERPVFSEAGTPDVENLFARFGSGSPCLLLAGHTDVVPPGDAGAWRHGPFSGEVAEGELYGRGAVDMKGGIACMAAAASPSPSRRATAWPGSLTASPGSRSSRSPSRSATSRRSWPRSWAADGTQRRDPATGFSRAGAR